MLWRVICVLCQYFRHTLLSVSRTTNTTHEQPIIRSLSIHSIHSFSPHLTVHNCSQHYQSLSHTAHHTVSSLLSSLLLLRTIRGRRSRSKRWLSRSQFWLWCQCLCGKQQTTSEKHILSLYTITKSPLLQVKNTTKQLFCPSQHAPHNIEHTQCTTHHQPWGSWS